jgi:hypothetical protein
MWATGVRDRQEGRPCASSPPGDRSVVSQSLYISFFRDYACRSVSRLVMVAPKVSVTDSTGRGIYALASPFLPPTPLCVSRGPKCPSAYPPSPARLAFERCLVTTWKPRW